MRFFDSWKSNSESRRKRIIFLVCIGIASAFWLLTSLTKTYSISVPVPIKYANIPEGYVIVNSPPRKVFAKLQGDGFSLLRFDTEKDFDSIVIDCNKNNFEPTTSKRYKGDFSLNVAQNSISNQVRNNLIIQSISSDTVSIMLDEVREKRLSVKPNIDYSLPNGYVLSQPLILHPSEVVAVGAKSVLQKLDSINMTATEIGTIDGDFKGMAELVVPHSSMRLNPAVIDFEVNAEPITEKKLILTIEVRNEPDSIAVRTYPSIAEITVRTGVSKYDLVKQDQFKAYVDFNELNMRSPHLVLHVDKLFDWAQIAEINPRRVEYIIRK